MKIFAERITREKTLVYDLRAAIHGERRYFILRVAPASRNAFLQAVRQDKGFRLEDYGDILYRGWGEPDESLKNQLREQYGMYAQEQPPGA